MRKIGSELEICGEVLRENQIEYVWYTWLDAWMDGWSEHIYGEHIQAHIPCICMKLSLSLSPYPSSVLSLPFCPCMSAYVNMHACACMCEEGSPWIAHKNTIDRDLFSHIVPCFPNYPLATCYCFCFSFFSLNVMCTCIRQLFCAAYRIASLINMYVYICMFVCAWVCMLKNSPNFSFLIVSRFFTFSLYSQENHFINCQLDEYIGIVLSLHISEESFSQTLRNLVTIVALILKLLHSKKRQNTIYAIDGDNNKLWLNVKIKCIIIVSRERKLAAPHRCIQNCKCWLYYFYWTNQMVVICINGI